MPPADEETAFINSAKSDLLTPPFSSRNSGGHSARFCSVSSFDTETPRSLTTSSTFSAQRRSIDTLSRQPIGVLTEGTSDTGFHVRRGNLVVSGTDLSQTLQGLLSRRGFGRRALNALSGRAIDMLAKGTIDTRPHVRRRNLIVPGTHLAQVLQHLLCRRRRGTLLRCVTDSPLQQHKKSECR
jgi:hypothetical protein